MPERLNKDLFQTATQTRNKMFLFGIICGLLVAQGGGQFHGNADSMVFPGPISSRTQELNGHTKEGKLEGSKLSKSLQLARELDAFKSADDFLSVVHGAPEVQKKFFTLTSRFGESEERSNAEHPVPATCMPELQSVPLKQDNDPATIVYPICTRVKRCGGCCSHALLSCQPTATEIRNFEVHVAGIDESMELSYRGKRIVPVEEHTKCQCDCRIKAEHCTDKQSYVPDECRCACNNIDEQEKCLRDIQIKVWDQDKCTCSCRETLQECSTGLYFDHNTCRCQRLPLSRSWFAPTKGTDYRFGQTRKPENVPPVIVSLDAADPRRKPKDDPERKRR